MTEKLKARSTLSSLERLKFPNEMEAIEPMSLALFFAGLEKEINLPREVAHQPELFEQAKQRRNLYQLLRTTFEQVKDIQMDFGEAVQRRLLAPETLTTIYRDLTEFIEKDENNTRILLYLPIQLLPNLRGAEKPSETLRKAETRFGRVCRDSWIRLLFESEPRASFVDGDVLEPGLGEPERIRKAGHLTPDLLERGIISGKDIIDLLEISTEEELLKSLIEGAIVAGDRNLIKFTTGSQAESSRHQVFEDSAKISQKRAEWKAGIERDKVVDQMADRFALKLRNGEVEMTEIKTEEEAIALVRGIAKVAKGMAAEDLLKASKFTESYQLDLQKFWRNGSNEVKNAVTTCLAHLRRLDIISNEFLKKFGLKLPDLSLPFPIDLEQLVDGNYQDLLAASQKIREHPQLSKEVYPFFLVFGSRVKGYASLGVDRDLAIFIRPGVPWKKHKEMIQRLRNEIPEIGSADQVLEYWVEEKEGKLGLRPLPAGTENVVGAAKADFLLGGVWIGQKDEIEAVYKSIFKKYLNLAGFGEQKEQVRLSLLRQIELDIVQYRLMHKGYRQMYPSQRGEGTQHRYLIDWESDFWDPGYRRIASLLFISRVFLPDLSS